MSFIGRRKRDERGAETVAMLFVIPVMVILVLALIDVGMMFRARMLVESVYRDAARGAASDGGNMFPRTNTSGHPAGWEGWAMDRMWKENHCTLSSCHKAPDIDCKTVTSTSGVARTSQYAEFAGETITCEGHYAYKPINGPLLNGPIGLGMGNLLKEFDVSVSARAETGAQGSFG